ncbi:MAG: autotransporter assembly complex protein TamA [Francisellaceae bacterium]
MLWILLLLSQSAFSAADTSAQKTLSVEIKGISDPELIKVIRENISIEKYKSFALESDNNLMLMLHKSDEDIKNILQPYGYYQPEVENQIIKKGNNFTATFTIKLNKAMHIGQVNITITGAGKDDKAVKNAIAEIPLKKGEILTQNNWDAAKNLLNTSAFNAGFLDARMTKNEILVNLKENTAILTLTLDSGPLYHIGDIDIKQSRYDYSDDLIRRLIELKSGDSFKQRRLSKATERLQQSGYFSGIQIIPHISQRDKTLHLVKLTIELTSAYARTYSFGVGYGSFTGPRVSFGTLFRHVTNSGQQFNFNIEASPANSTFSSNYIIPGADPLHDNLSLNATQSYIDTNTYDERLTSLGITKNKKIGRFTLSLGLSQYFTVYSTDAHTSDESANYFVPSFQLAYNGLQSNGFFSTGFTWYDLMQISIKTRFSDKSFVRNAMNLGLSLPFDKNWNRFFVSSNAGIIGVDDIQSVAPNFRFYAGGIGNLLGYAYQSQGPEVDGNVTGGRYLATASAGLEQRIFGNFSTLVAYNIGNASNRLDFSDVEILKSASLGLSYKSPLGPILLYLSRTLNPGDQHWRLDLSIGVSL